MYIYLQARQREHPAHSAQRLEPLRECAVAGASWLTCRIGGPASWVQRQPD